MIFSDQKFLLLAPIASFFVVLMFMYGAFKASEKLNKFCDIGMRHKVLSNFSNIKLKFKIFTCAIVPIFYSLILSGTSISDGINLKIDVTKNLIVILIFVLIFEQLIPIRKRDRHN